RDLPGNIGARDVREGNRDAVESAALPEIEMVQRARAHANDGMPRARFRIRSVLIRQNVRSTVLVEANGFHRSLSSQGSATRRTGARSSARSPASIRSASPTATAT